MDKHNKMSKEKTKEEEHEARIDAEWKRSLEMGQDIERSEIAELLASDSDSTSDEEFCFGENTTRSGNYDSSSDYDKPMSEMAKKYLDKNQSKICFDKKKTSAEKEGKMGDVSTSSSDGNDQRVIVLKQPVLCPREINTGQKWKPKSQWISKRKSVTPVTVKKEKKRRKRRVKKRLGLDPFQQADFAKHTGNDFYGF